MLKACLTEALGTFWLVLGGCGCAILAANGQTNAIGPLGVSLAFGLTVVTMAFAFGRISGGHFNPAVTVGLAVANKFPTKKIAGYVGSQLVGAILAAGFLYLLASGQPGFNLDNHFAANGFEAHSPGGFGALSALTAEVIFSAFFILIILGSIEGQSAAAPIIIGLTLTLIHLVLIPIDNASVNPARSTGQAIFVGGWALAQLWLFWVGPLVGAALGAVVYRFLSPKR